MKKLLTLLGLVLCIESQAQITITSADMPVAGDTLRYSIASPATDTFIVLTDTGASVSWNYSLTPTSQAVDTYKTATSVNILYALTVPASAYGYKVADSLPGAPVSIKQLYTFYEDHSSCFDAVSFGANVSGLPTASNYSKNDTLFNFPLSYGRTDSSNYALNISLATIGSLKQTGYRKRRVDGWGTITTPYYTSGIACIRVRSEIHEIDSVTFSGASFGFPRNTVEYRWLVNGDHYPALFVITTLLPAGGGERISSIRYRDSLRTFDTTSTPPVDTVNNGVRQVAENIAMLKAYPNPAISGIVTIDVPKAWTTFTIDVFDNQSRQVASVANKRVLNLRALPPGQYLARVISGSQVGYVLITR